METTETEYFNPDETWQAYVRTLEPYVRKIAQKYCSHDEALRADAEQEARMALYTIRPEYIEGTPDVYCRNVIRNSILSYLHSYKTGDWYSGRTAYRENKDGSYRKAHVPPRFSSYDQLADEFGLQVAEDGSVSWVNDDGLSYDDEAEATNEAIVATDPDANERQLLARVELDDLLASLTDDAAQSVRDYLDGASQFPYVAIHTLACVQGVEALCVTCGQTREASEFTARDWMLPDKVCRDCAKPAADCGTVERWKQGCRCDECVEAKSDAEDAKLRARLEAGQCGTVTQFRRGCRCDACTEAQRADDRVRRRKRREMFPRLRAVPPCGSVRKYRKGCRCDACRAVYNDYQRGVVARRKARRPKVEKRAPKAPKAKKPKPEPEHGTMAKHRRGCRCVPCVEAAREYQRAKYRQKRERLGLPERKPRQAKVEKPKVVRVWRHGTEYGYTKHRCRCAECVEAMRAHDRAKYRRKRERLGLTITAKRPGPPEAPHGTRSRYNNQKCRCPECREAQRLYSAQLRERTKNAA